jgi:hypothetical protein
MNLHEYQAKTLLNKYQVPTQEGIACSSVDEAIAAYVAAQGRGPMTIRATAFPVEGGPSEARRRAYFRAMLVRTRFMKAGIRPQDIEIQVRDDIQASAQEVVDIFKKSGG